MNTSVGRLRQIVAAITERRWFSQQDKLGELRTLCTFIAATVPGDSDTREHPLLDLAQSIGGEVVDERVTETTESSNGREVRVVKSDRPAGWEAREVINPVGSFETFTSMTRPR